jgi:molybdopterin/thiamine biosynthesis adenylyltransferase
MVYSDSVSSLPRVLLIGAGGIGNPFVLTLARAVRAGETSKFELTIVDDDRVELENLHRQVLFTDADIGSAKAVALARRAQEIAPELETSTALERFLPDSALGFASSATLIVDASDNFATRFLAADACFLAQRPLVSAASVRWVATVLASLPTGPCYRCLFEDLPEGPAPDCSTAGIVGPVCGVAGALAAELALQLLAGQTPSHNLFSFDGRSDTLRARSFKPRTGCELCGSAASIRGLQADRYAGQACGEYE